MSGIHVIQGKPALGAGLIAGRIKASGRYNFKVIRLDDEGCVIEFYENAEKIGVSAFERADAAKSGLLERDMWRKFPRNMYWARALSNGARWYCPDVFSGSIYTAEELGGGEVVEAEYHEVAPEPAASKPTVLPYNRSNPAEFDEESKPVIAPHWIEDANTRAKFWAWTRGTLALSDKEVHAALGVEHIREFTGDKSAAMAAIQDYIDRQAQPDDGADKVEVTL
jgi:hypothetical protein